VLLVVVGSCLDIVTIGIQVAPIFGLMHVYTVAIRARCAQGLTSIFVQTQRTVFCRVTGRPAVPVRMLKALINMAGHINVAFIAPIAILLGPLSLLLAVAVPILAVASVAPRRTMP